MDFFNLDEEKKICNVCGFLINAEETTCDHCGSCSLREYNENEE